MGAKTAVRHWWTGHPDVVPCPECGCPIQTTEHGSIDTGMTQHLEAVHARPRGGAS